MAPRDDVALTESRFDLHGGVHPSRAGLVLAAAACVGLWSSCVLAATAEEALRSPALTSKIAEFRQTCSDETIDAKPTPVVLTPGATAVLVRLTSSKCLCFGQPGESNYLLTGGAACWRIALTAEPGSMVVGRPDAKGFANVTLHGLGLCQIA